MSERAAKAAAIDPQTYDKARELTTRIERGDANALREVLDYQKTKSPKENNLLLTTMEVNNINDRQLDKRLPKLIIVTENGRKQLERVDPNPQKTEAQEAQKAQVAQRQVDRSSRSAVRGQVRGEPTNTTAGREYVADSTANPGKYQ